MTAVPTRPTIPTHGRYGAMSGGEGAEPEPPASPFVTDTFTDTSALALTAHTGELGATWTKHTSYATSSLVISDANRMRPASNISAVYHASGVPASADYDVEANIRVLSSDANSHAAVAGRINTGANTLYYARYFTTSGAWELVKLVAGASTTLAPSFTQALSVGVTYKVKLEMRGTTLKVYIDDVERISLTDAAIAAAGVAGVRTGQSTFANTTGMHFDSFNAYDA